MVVGVPGVHRASHERARQSVVICCIGCRPGFDALYAEYEAT